MSDKKPETPADTGAAKKDEQIKPPHVLDLSGVEWGLHKGGMASGPVGHDTVAHKNSDFGLNKGGMASGPVGHDTVSEHDVPGHIIPDKTSN